MSMVAPVSSVMERMVTPPCRSHVIRIFHRIDAQGGVSGNVLGRFQFGPSMTAPILSRICKRPSRAWITLLLHNLAGDAVDLDIHHRGGRPGGGTGRSKIISIADDPHRR